MKKSTLAMATLALSLSQASVAETTTQNEGELKSTYWGLGIGTVLGAVIAGPPGAAAGAALGSSIGWGQDKDTELERVTDDFDHIQQRNASLEKSLNKSRQVSQVLERENAHQAARLADLNALDLDQKHGQQQADELLKAMAGHYTQEIYYRHNSSGIPDYAKARLQRLSEFMVEHSSVVIRLQGHTDLIGAEESNRALAKARVDAIKDELVELGIDAARIQTEALGEEHATVAAGDASNYVLDRRVAIKLDVPDRGSVELNVEQGDQPVALAGEGM